MLTLNEQQHNDAIAQRRAEALLKTIHDLAEEKFNELPLLYTQPTDIFQYSNMDDAVTEFTLDEWQAIARELRDKQHATAGRHLEAALRRVCLRWATDTR